MKLGEIIDQYRKNGINSIVDEVEEGSLKIRYRIIDDTESKGENFRSFLMKYLKEFSKDPHKFYIKYSVNKNMTSFLYLVAEDENTGEVVAGTGYEILSRKPGEKEGTNHCLFVRPKYRGLKLSEKVAWLIEEYVKDSDPEFRISRNTCNELSASCFKRIGYQETGVFRTMKNGERCQIRLARTLR